ncbi:amino acid permease [Mucilaginibacter terrigena]|uniref:Amino acid permease n=1 Tax=Mucilaginibacter terrigena TaxID=2492395 RepID=A0A4Q5LHY7_9SPHI|nr:amino acid permease [Mucilaginibacter terrigena]
MNHCLTDDPAVGTSIKGNLKRTIGVFGLACAVINITIGTGIFILPAIVAEHLGAAAIICFLICGLLIFLIALCFAEVGTKVTGSGGTYAYIEAAFGPWLGFLANNIFWLSCCLSDAAVANGLSKTLGYFYPPLDTTFRPLFFLLLMVVFAWINIRGSKGGVNLVIAATLAKIVPLVLLVIFGVSHISAANLNWTSSFTLGNIGSATLILFYAFLGIENAVANSGEFKNPSRVVPLGILSGLSFVLLLYIAIQLITQGMLGTQLQLYKDAPLAEVSKRLFAYTGIILITVGAAVSMLGSLSGAILAIPRVLFAGAKDGIFPKFLGDIHSKYITPHKAIILYAAIDYIFAVFGAFKQLVVLSTASVLLIYLGVVLAAIKLRYKKPVQAETTFTIPGGLTVPILATVTIIWLLYSLTNPEIIGMSIALAALSVIYLLMKLYNNKQKQLFADK